MTLHTCGYNLNYSLHHREAEGENAPAPGDSKQAERTGGHNTSMQFQQSFSFSILTCGVVSVVVLLIVSSICCVCTSSVSN